MTLNEG